MRSTPRIRSQRLDAQTAVRSLLQTSRRKGRAAQIRRSLLQVGAAGRTLPGPLADLVRRGDERALDMYLLLLALIARPPADVTLDVAVWTAALGAQGTDPRRTLRKVVSRLEGQRLARYHPLSGALEVLSDDGSGRAYTRPGDPHEHDPYFKLPFEYWLNENRWHRELSLPAKAMLLIALSHRDEFALPGARVPDWYGISRDTAQRGLVELRHRELLSVVRGVKAAPSAPHGITHNYRYTVNPHLRSPRRQAAA